MFSIPINTSKILLSRQKQRNEDIRGPYFRDQTAIIHALAFRRLKHKTQVFFAPDNDHICTRIEHSMHVSSISATICRALGLNTEIVQAAGLGHDLGHAPFGHAGEKTLRFLSDHNFQHELHSLRVIDKLENKGKGLNLTFAVRDAIASHCGEAIEQFIDIAKTPNDLENLKRLPKSPSTWEGCVVRVSDSIAYLGRDIEDAMTATCITLNDIPSDIKMHIGQTNSEIIKTLVYDVIDWSDKNGKIGFSPEIFKYVTKLKKFSREKIYQNPKLKYWNHYSDFVLKSLFNYFKDIIDKYNFNFDLYSSNNSDLESKFGQFIESIFERYQDEHADNNRIITDYIAGMTDTYALQCFKYILSTGTTGF